jgi:hypothetical protein
MDDRQGQTAPGCPHLRRAGARQAGLQVIARTNRWLISGALIFAGALTALTAHAFHARAAASAARVLVGRAASSRPSADHDSSAPLQPPAGAPAAGPAPTPAPAPVSGGS